MLAKDYSIGKKFKHTEYGVITVVEVYRERYFENINGDLFCFIDEDFIECEI